MVVARGASVIAAVGGSADRFFGLRYLTPEAWAGYFALYEVFSKFWFIPYVVTPILFTRTAGGRGSRSLARWALVLTTAGGVLFVGGIVASLMIQPAAPALLLGKRLSEHIPNPAIVAFAIAVALNSLAQIRIAELQGGERSTASSSYRASAPQSRWRCSIWAPAHSALLVCSMPGLRNRWWSFALSMRRSGGTDMGLTPPRQATN